MAVKDFTQYDEALAAIRKLAANWEREVQETERRRNVRYHNVSIQELRTPGRDEQGKPVPARLKPHEVYIPIRVADTNIKREQATWVSYITQSPRLGVFMPLGAVKDASPIERDFTTFGKYEGWEIPFFKVIDGAQTHGTDFIETIFDPSKPGHFANIHLGHDHVFYPEDTEDLQKAEYILVDCQYSKADLLGFVEEKRPGWDRTAVNEILESLEGAEDAESSVRLNKFYFKQREESGTIVYLGYQHDSATSWVCSPQKLNYGKVVDGLPVFESEYPIECLPYSVSENGRLIDIKGRVFMDEPAQEAATQAFSNYVNGTTISSWLMGWVDTPGEGGDMKEVPGALIGNGKIWNQKMNLFHVEPPPAECLQAAQAIVTQNEAEQSQPNFAVNNRKDSRKTATEIQTATQQGAMLSSVQVTLLGLFMRNVLRRCWEIASSQVVQGKIATSCPELYAEKYIILPSGDADVIRRQERQTKMRQDWPVIQQTPAAQIFLEQILRESYPDMAQSLINAIKQGNVKDQLLMAIPQRLAQMAQADPNLNAALAPHKQELQGWAAQIQQALNPQQEAPEQAQAA